MKIEKFGQISMVNGELSITGFSFDCEGDSVEPDSHELAIEIFAVIFQQMVLQLKGKVVFSDNLYLPQQLN